jgi:signal transduction histidine kinase
MILSARDTARFPDVAVPEIDSGEFSSEERHALTAINRRVTAAQDLEEVLEFLFDATRDIIPTDRLSLAFLDETGQRVASHWTRTSYEPVLLKNGFAQDLAGSTLEGIIETNRPRVISDLEQYLREHPDSVSTRIVVKEGLRSSMTCPLVVEGRPVGLLFRSSLRPNAYDRHQVRLHLAIAERLAHAVEKTWRIEQLAMANRAYFEMLGFVSHELKSPLASLVMDIESLLDESFGSLNDRQRECLQKMTSKAHYLLTMVGEYLNLAKIENSAITLNLEDDVNVVDESVRPAIEIVHSLMERDHMTLDIQAPEQPFLVRVDPSLLIVAILNLLSNAVKYGKENGKIKVTVEQTEELLRVSVWNEGLGFPADESMKLFRRFSRLQSPELLKKKGTGVGLYTTRRIVQLHGGRIWAESKQGEWAKFSFEIPLPVPENAPK